jgi:hypothetical protein
MFQSGVAGSATVTRGFMVVFVRFRASTANITRTLTPPYGRDGG